MEDNHDHGSAEAMSDDPASELSEAYMLSLASLGLARLQDEPLRLEDEARAVDEALHDLSLDQYRVFIVNQDCVRHMKLKGADMAQHIRALEEGLEGLAGGFITFQKEAAELLAGHRRNKQTLAHHMQLVELLEIPQLMDTCVRNSAADSAFAEDALALAGFTQGLLARHMRTMDGSSEPQVPAVIALIAEEVAKSLRSLRSRMLASLRGNASLASCLQVVSCLRRLELLQLSSSATAAPHQRRRRRSKAHTQGSAAGAAATEAGGTDRGDSEGLLELRLQVAFLEARDAWLQSVLDDIGIAAPLPPPADGSSGSSSVADADGRARGRGHLSPYSYLVDVIETCRTHWFEIATQFRAIFGADGDAALAAWLARRVGAFAALLRAALPLVEDAASVRSLLEQCMSFAASMGRLGADFRGLLVPAFEAAVWNSVTAQWRAATRAFQEGLARLAKASARSSAAARSGAGAPPPLPLCVQKAPLGTPRAGNGAANGERWGACDRAAAAAEGDGDALLPPPPLSLLNYPLLAHFFNDVVAGLNHLRECAPLSLEAGLQEHLALCVDAVCEALAAHRRALRSAGGSGSGGSSGAGGGGGGGSSGSSDDAVGVAAHAMAAHVVPHLAACFCHIFTGGGGAAHDAARGAYTKQLLEGLSSRGLVEPEVELVPVAALLPPAAAPSAVAHVGGSAVADADAAAVEPSDIAAESTPDVEPEEAAAAAEAAPGAAETASTEAAEVAQPASSAVDQEVAPAEAAQATQPTGAEAAEGDEEMPVLPLPEVSPLGDVATQSETAEMHLHQSSAADQVADESSDSPQAHLEQ